MPDPNNPNANTTPSYRHSQEMRVMHEFKEGTLEILSGAWDEG